MLRENQTALVLAILAWRGRRVGTEGCRRIVTV
jgi:hypothetical protein